MVEITRKREKSVLPVAIGSFDDVPAEISRPLDEMKENLEIIARQVAVVADAAEVPVQQDFTGQIATVARAVDDVADDLRRLRTFVNQLLNGWQLIGKVDLFTDLPDVNGPALGYVEDEERYYAREGTKAAGTWVPVSRNEWDPVEP